MVVRGGLWVEGPCTQILSSDSGTVFLAIEINWSQQLYDASFNLDEGEGVVWVLEYEKLLVLAGGIFHYGTYFLSWFWFCEGLSLFILNIELDLESL